MTCASVVDALRHSDIQFPPSFAGPLCEHSVCPFCPPDLSGTSVNSDLVTLIPDKDACRSLLRTRPPSDTIMVVPAKLMKGLGPLSKSVTLVRRFNSDSLIGSAFSQSQGTPTTVYALLVNVI